MLYILLALHLIILASIAALLYLHLPVEKKEEVEKWVEKKKKAIVPQEKGYIAGLDEDEARVEKMFQEADELNKPLKIE